MAAVIAICINHIRVNRPHTAALRIVETTSHQIVQQKVQQKVHPEAIAAALEQATVVKRLEQQRRVIHQKAIIITTLMIKAMMTFIWMEIMTTTDMIEIVTMQWA